MFRMMRRDGTNPQLVAFHCVKQRKEIGDHANEEGFRQTNGVGQLALQAREESAAEESHRQKSGSLSGLLPQPFDRQRIEGGEENRNEKPENNDYFLASQFWITGEMYTKRPDLVGFVNGLPLILIEFKAVHQGPFGHGEQSHKNQSHDAAKSEGVGRFHSLLHP